MKEMREHVLAGVFLVVMTVLALCIALWPRRITRAYSLHLAITPTPTQAEAMVAAAPSPTPTTATVSTTTATTAATPRTTTAMVKPTAPTLEPGFFVYKPVGRHASYERQHRGEPGLGPDYWRKIRNSVMINTNNPRTDRYISGSIHRSGMWDAGITRLLQTLLRREKKRGGQLFVDVGANIGYFSLIAADHGHRVIAFEPMRANSWRLVSSVKRNGMEAQWTLYENAVSDKAGRAVELKPTDLTTNRSNGRIVGERQQVTPQGAYGVDYVWTVRLDDVVPEGSDVVVMKMDVEGHEGLTLQGASKTMCRSIVRHVIAEWTDVRTNGYCDHTRALAWMKALGYRIGGLAPGGVEDLPADHFCGGTRRKGCPHDIWFELRDATKTPYDRLGYCPAF